MLLPDQRKATALSLATLAGRYLADRSLAAIPAG